MYMIQPIVDFNVRPSEEEIIKILEEARRHCDDPVSREDVDRAIQKAERFLHWVAEEVNREFSFWAQNEEEVSVKVQYWEGENLDWTCKFPGSPFNNVYPEGPTVHVVISGRVSIKPKEYGYKNGLDLFVMATDGGFFLMVRMPKHNMFVAFRNA